jgi:protein-S-isoprenylcysteine O-methyltransferase Ste14
MHKLELKVPPPVVALLIAAAMWGLSLLGPPAAAQTGLRTLIAIAIACCGIGIDIAGAVAFRRARTTINPLKPTAASSLVMTGVYRFTRNPMYVGLAVVLLAWAIWLASFPAWLGLPAFVLYISRFQIAPEERALAGIFGTAFADYQSKVRRWL